ncbi:hypothetical protein ACFUCV_04255, partial [Specibacter sp. NPDC057265]|uniref:hypothetical protein n=1 Tax=Specibacter sp. NPDC057265 TaxID=3346075 RepID=UPI003639493B
HGTITNFGWVSLGHDCHLSQKRQRHQIRDGSDLPGRHRRKIQYTPEPSWDSSHHEKRALNYSTTVFLRQLDRFG